ncbi:MAG: DEAD/DEAH box helicase family protein [Thiotrichaceae bacterium]|nr:DEAD/DEAH box helicase family protein [Thiotrichaceae bacterium]
MSFVLKNYQKQTLDALELFLSDARLMPVADAFEKSLLRQGIDPYLYRHYSFDETPYVCLRLPTGGGKTVLASHAVRIATRAYLEKDYPIVLWLVPTSTIQRQTLEALKTQGHPYRVELDRAFDQRVKVLDAGEVNQIRAHDIGNQVIVVVSTLANLRVEKTSDRKVYAYHEDFEPHFSRIDKNDPRLERVTEADLKENGLGKAALGKVKFSFANLLALHGPLVIMDEAHNARTSLTFDTLKRIHPKCIIEFTATPDLSLTSGSNVLYRVSASELKAEEMIKLPIMLTEHDDWQAAVEDAVLTRNRLAIEAQNEPDYVRPMTLFQAEPKNGTVTWQVLKKYLIEEQHIDEKAIAVVTGTQRELNDINLFDRSCPIEHVITIDALKEGWDCSFAYVFCSVRDVKSSRNVEQLLGRVLRMPYAKRRSVDALNRSYAHLASPHFAEAASQLVDKLVDMGFEAQEIPSSIQRGYGDDLFGPNDGGHFSPPQEPPLEIDLPSLPEIKPEHKPLMGNVTVSQNEDGTTKVQVKGLLDEDVAKGFLKLFKGKDKKEVQTQIEQHNARVQAYQSPSEKGELFSPLPGLCFLEQGELALIEPETFLFLKGDWSPLDFSIELSNFSLKKGDTTYEIDMDGKKVSYRIAEEQETYNLDFVDTDITEYDLIRFLDRELRNVHFNQSVMVKFISQTISHLINDKGFTLTALVRSKFLLVKAIQKRLQILREQATQQGFQSALFDDVIPLEASFNYQFEFKPGLYPARPPLYSGRYTFRKHYYPTIEDIRVDGEEFFCARDIDSHPAVKFWVRNLVARPAASFRLPIAGGWFYPDFVVQLEDGRVLVIEYKGEVYKTNDDSREKNNVGKLWAEKGGDDYLFLMAVNQDDQGRNVYQQLGAVIDGPVKNRS